MNGRRYHVGQRVVVTRRDGSLARGAVVYQRSIEAVSVMLDEHWPSSSIWPAECVAPASEDGEGRTA